MKKMLSLLTLCLGAASIWAQNFPATNPQSEVGARGSTNNMTSSGGVTFSNQVGQSFSANQLATQLQTLRSAVDNTLPLLSAFNQSYSNSVSGTQGSASGVSGALSGIVNDVFHRNQGAQNNGQSFMSASNLLSMLHGLLNTNSTGAGSTPPANAEDLKTLQTELQPVAAVLQRLNVSPAPTTPNNGYSNGNLTPTGR